jgi:uncharacterized protein
VIVYLDTSALVKLYVTEPGSKAIHRAVNQADASATHAIAYAETCAAFAKAVRLGRMSLENLGECRRAFDEDWERLEVIAADSAIIKRAGDLACASSLRGYDSVHLAATEALAIAAGVRGFRFAAFDVTLNEAASALGLPLLSQR